MNDKQIKCIVIIATGAFLLVLQTIIDLFYFPVSLWFLVIPFIIVFGGLSLLAWESDKQDAIVEVDE